MKEKKWKFLKTVPSTSSKWIIGSNCGSPFSTFSAFPVTTSGSAGFCGSGVDGLNLNWNGFPALGFGASVLAPKLKSNFPLGFLVFTFVGVDSFGGGATGAGVSTFGGAAADAPAENAVSNSAAISGVLKRIANFSRIISPIKNVYFWTFDADFRKKIMFFFEKSNFGKFSAKVQFH